MTDKLVQKLFEDFWKWRLQRSPEYASLTGSKEHDNQLETYLPSRFEEDHLKCLEFLEKAKAFGKDEMAISDETRLNLELFKSELNTFIDGYNSFGFLFPINNIEGIQVDFSRLSDWMSVSSQKDYHNLICRYEKFPLLTSNIMETMREGLRRKMTNHAVTMTAVLSQLAQHQGDPKLTVFWEPFKDLPETIDIEEAEKLRLEAEVAIRDKIQPAMAEVSEFLKNEYLPNTRPEIGAISLPNGVEFYNQCLKFHTSSERYSAKTIHEIGIGEVKRIEDDMRQVFDEVSFKGTLKEFVDYLRKDEKMIFKTSQELFDHFSNLIFNVIQPKLKDFFFQEPQSKLLVVQTPSGQSKAPAAYYICGTADGSRPGKVFVNCNNPDTRLKCQLTSLALHEANPGHHLQASHALNQKFMPEFRRFMEDRNYFQAPSRFPINTAFCEGWALYCEKLGFEMGLYENPYDRFGHYSEEMFRACRLVVDTGIHAFGWSRDQAIQYMLDHTATPKHEIEIEIDRYIGWPGQAIGYKIGELFLTDLRRKAERSLQDRFDLRQFHEVLLNTAGPLDLVEKEVELYIHKTTS